MTFPKVLIIGQAFDRKSGGGITISNLFHGWPKDKIAVASQALLKGDIDTSICDKYYQLSYKGGKLHPFPFSIFLKKTQTGIIKIFENPANSTKQVNLNRKSSQLYNILFKILNYFGLYNFLYTISVQQEFVDWVLEYKPDFIYTMLGSLSSIRFVNELSNKANVPIAIHIMDDWPSTISKESIINRLWRRTIDKEFRQILDKSNVLFSISEKMSEEYLKRYSKTFYPFFNPVDVEAWLPYSKKNWGLHETFTVLYAGRIGIGTSDSILEIARAIKVLNNDLNYNIQFQLQITVKRADKVLKRIKEYEFVTFNPVLDYKMLPLKFSNVDLLLLPMDFGYKNLNYIRLSMPTKTGEYMISGTPIMVYASPNTALAQYALKDKWAYVVSERNIVALMKAFKELYDNIETRQRLGETAKQIGSEKLDSGQIRTKFRQIFTQNLS